VLASQIKDFPEKDFAAGKALFDKFVFSGKRFWKGSLEQVSELATFMANGLTLPAGSSFNRKYLPVAHCPAADH